MFGPEHSLVDASQGASQDPKSPGFGPYGTTGHHCFDAAHPRTSAWLICSMSAASSPFSAMDASISVRSVNSAGQPRLSAGRPIAWSRILDDKEALIVVNGNSRCGAVGK